MHHLYPSLKGDQLCPLGFHPQTRYPTRCKRCYRDYKEHGGRRGLEDVTSSSPNLTDNLNSRPSSRSWTSTQNLFTPNSNENSNDIVVHFNVELKKRPLSWASTSDLADVAAQSSSSNNSSNSNNLNSSSNNRTAKPVENNVDVTVRLPPPRRHTTTLDIKEVEQSLLVKRSPSPSARTSASPSKSIPDELVILSTDSLAERVRKMNLLKKQRSLNSRENSQERATPKKNEPELKPKTQSDQSETAQNSSSSIKSVEKKSALPPRKTTTSSTSSSTTLTSATKNLSVQSATSSSSKLSYEFEKETLLGSLVKSKSAHTVPSTSSSSSSKTTTKPKLTSKEKTSQDVDFMLKVKDSKLNSEKKHEQDNISSATTDTTTLVGAGREHEYEEEIKYLRSELEAMKTRAERAEREKSDILLRRLAAMETAPNRTAASEALMLQQKVNELKAQLEKVQEEKTRLNTRMKQIENNPKGSDYELKRKLQAAEQLCEELMEENQEAKKEIKSLHDEMDELQDSFREDEVKEKASLQKDLEKTTKNCRILSFKLKKCERKIESLEQENQNIYNGELTAKVKRLEEELKFSNELTRKLQAEAEELRNPGKKRTPMLGVIGKSTSADAKITRESLTTGGSHGGSQDLLRDLQDSAERESDLREQLKFAEEEGESLRKKVARFEDENDSLMMQLKKMATRSRTRKLSPTAHRMVPESHASDHDEGISDEDDPAELRILLDLNEQEASILRMKVDDLEKENKDIRKQLRDLQEKDIYGSKKGSLLSSIGVGGSNAGLDKKVKSLNDEIAKLRQTIAEKDTLIEKLKSGKGYASNNINTKRQLDMVEQEAAVLRTKITTLENENEKLLKDNKRMQLQASRKSISNDKSNSSEEVSKLKENLLIVEQARDQLDMKLKRILQECEEKLPPRAPKRITDLTPKNHLKKWVEELEDEVIEMRALVLNSGADKLKILEQEKKVIDDKLKETKLKLSIAEDDLEKLKISANSTSKVSSLEQKLKKTDEEARKLSSKVKDLEDKIKKQDSQIKLAETAKATLETQTKRDKERLNNLEKDYEKERKEREKCETKVQQLESEILSNRKIEEKIRLTLEKEIKELKLKTGSSKSESKQITDLRKQIDELQYSLDDKSKRYTELNTHWEKLSEETILMRAQLTTEKQNLQTELNTAKQKLNEVDAIRVERTELAKKLNDAQRKIQELESKNIKTGSSDYEKAVLKNKLADKTQEYDRLKRENEMNIDLVFQLRKENDDINSKLNDFQRIEQAKSSLNGHSAALESEIRTLRTQLQNSELQMKSEVAATRLRYEQQVKNLSAELTSMQRQCEKFKKDRDAFKQMLELAQKKIGELKSNNTGRQSRGSMHSSDDDDKSKIAYLEQQIGCLEDQLVESRLEANKVKTELVSERSANEIKISEMQSKLNEYEEERVIGSGRTKIPGIKTKLELSWQKEREDQQRLLQETSTLARDLRQTLFEVERERDKERLEAKRRLEQLKNANEEEMEEGRRKIAELQCDLLELRDVHAKLRTSNEKLRRERERYEKELIKRRMEHDGGERKVGALLQTVDELVKIAPDLKIAAPARERSTERTLRPEVPARASSPSLSNSQIGTVLARLAEASEELRRFQRMNEDENERNRMRRGNMRRATSQENDPYSSSGSVASVSDYPRSSSKLSRSSGHNGSLIKKSLSLDHSMQRDQNIWRNNDGSVSSIQSIESDLGGMVRDSSCDSRLDSRLSGGSTQSDIPRGPRKKKKGLMGKLRSFAKSSRNSESEVSVQGSDSDISVASDIRMSKKDLRGRLSDMFKRSGSQSRSASTERTPSEQRPVAVTVVGDEHGPRPRDPPPAVAKPLRSITKPPTPTLSTTPTKNRSK